VAYGHTELADRGVLLDASPALMRFCVGWLVVIQSVSVPTGSAARDDSDVHARLPHESA
jgi:hypothetical protein